MRSLNKEFTLGLFRLRCCQTSTVGVKSGIQKTEVWNGDKKLTLMVIKLEFKVLKMDAITRGEKRQKEQRPGLYHGSETIAFRAN